MEKETITSRTAPPPAAAKVSDAPLLTMSTEKARLLIRKTTKQHAELFRRLAQ